MVPLISHLSPRSSMHRASTRQYAYTRQPGSPHRSHSHTTAWTSALPPTTANTTPLAPLSPATLRHAHPSSPYAVKPTTRRLIASHRLDTMPPPPSNLQPAETRPFSLSRARALFISLLPHAPASTRACNRHATDNTLANGRAHAPFDLSTPVIPASENRASQTHHR